MDVQEVAVAFFWASALVGCWRIACWLADAPRELEALVALPVLLLAWVFAYLFLAINPRIQC